MKNLLILYNPYYQANVISAHLEVLKEQGAVAFGKIRSKLKDKFSSDLGESSDFLKSFANILRDSGLDSTLDSQKSHDSHEYHKSKRNFIQLFLTDYANLYVAKVVDIVKSADSRLIPRYYDEKSLNVECYFIIDDLREIVRDDFALIRDKYLANFTTHAFANHTSALYGHAYTYPLEVAQKREI